MDSINANQPEENRADLTGNEAVSQIKETVQKAETCFFCTSVPKGDSCGTRPMNVREADDEGNLWFLSSRDSHKNAELAVDPSVRIYFQGSPHSHFLYLKGRAQVMTDRRKIRELWGPLLKTWFTGGVDDPRLTVIKFTPEEGFYWDTKHGKAVAGMKILAGALLGKTLDDSIEGTVVP